MSLTLYTMDKDGNTTPTNDVLEWGRWMQSADEVMAGHDQVLTRRN